MARIHILSATRFAKAGVSRDTGEDSLLCRRRSPGQVAGHLAHTGRFSISHETIYRHVWRDKRAGGLLYTHLRGARWRRMNEEMQIE